MSNEDDVRYTAAEVLAILLDVGERVGFGSRLATVAQQCHPGLRGIDLPRAKYLPPARHRED
jgi:hypothetical protein